MCAQYTRSPTAAVCAWRPTISLQRNPALTDRPRPPCPPAPSRPSQPAGRYWPAASGAGAVTSASCSASRCWSFSWPRQAAKRSVLPCRSGDGVSGRGGDWRRLRRRERLSDRSFSGWSAQAGAGLDRPSDLANVITGEATRRGTHTAYGAAAHATDKTSTTPTQSVESASVLLIPARW